MKIFEKKYIVYIIIAVVMIIIATILLFFSLYNRNNFSNNIPNFSKQNDKKEDFLPPPDDQPIQVTLPNSIIENQILKNQEKPVDTNISNIDTTQNQTNNSKTESFGIIEIPSTNLSLPILKEVSVAGMEKACCILYTTGELNKTGNTCIVGHNYENNKLFSNNSKIKIGDSIFIEDKDKNKVEYIVYNIFNTTSFDTSYLTKDIESNSIEITLETCNNDKEDTRLIIEAKHQI